MNPQLQALTLIITVVIQSKSDDESIPVMKARTPELKLTWMLTPLLFRHRDQSAPVIGFVHGRVGESMKRRKKKPRVSAVNKIRYHLLLPSSEDHHHRCRKTSLRRSPPPLHWLIRLLMQLQQRLKLLEVGYEDLEGLTGTLFISVVNLSQAPLHVPLVHPQIAVVAWRKASMRMTLIMDSTVFEAVEVKSSTEWFMIKMRAGRHLRCAHNNPQGGHVPDYAPHPAIVLKMEDDTGLLLSIIVLDMLTVLLMAAICNVQIARPTMYQVVREMVDKMGYKVRCFWSFPPQNVRSKPREYMRRILLGYISQSFDLRPSDAINIVVRCKVPIQVNKFLAHSDGMKAVESAKPAFKDLLQMG